jgi:hypothetical protein
MANRRHRVRDPTHVIAAGETRRVERDPPPGERGERLGVAAKWRGTKRASRTGVRSMTERVLSVDDDLAILRGYARERAIRVEDRVHAERRGEHGRAMHSLRSAFAPARCH